MDNKLKQLAIEYGTAICETIMEMYNPPAKLRHEGRFNYHQGVFLLGVEKFNKYVNKDEYIEYAKAWADSILRKADSIFDIDESVMNKGNLDDLQPAIILYDIYEKTGDPFYKKVLDDVIKVFDTYKCNDDGGFWHMEELPNQMWLDGLYMAGPLLSRYAVEFNKPELFDRVTLQAKLMFNHCYVPEKGLMKHGWDYSKEAEWADAETGVSAEFWGRAFGWFVVALTDILEFLPKDHKDRQALSDMLVLLLKNVVRYQDENTGLWYQVLDKGDRNDNWLETSCSMLFSMSLIRAVKRGFLPEEYMNYAQKAVYGILDRVELNGKKASLTGTCRGTMIGTYEYYIGRECRSNDLHGCGSFLQLMAAVLE